MCKECFYGMCTYRSKLGIKGLYGLRVFLSPFGPSSHFYPLPMSNMQHARLCCVIIVHFCGSHCDGLDMTALLGLEWPKSRVWGYVYVSLPMSCPLPKCNNGDTLRPWHRGAWLRGPVTNLRFDPSSWKRCSLVLFAHIFFNPFQISLKPTNP